MTSLQVREVLRRSRTSSSTLQVALYYLHKLRREFRSVINDPAFVPPTLRRLTVDESEANPTPPHSPSTSEAVAVGSRLRERNPLLCGRRMFLAALICAGKFLQDRNYSNKAWAKLAGLNEVELGKIERLFLRLMDHDLFIGANDFRKCED